MAKILVVDNELTIVHFLRKFLQKQKYMVVTASGGNEALEKVKQEKPDVVLLDIRMPDKDGMEVLKEIKQLDKNLSVIMITAVTDHEIGEKALELGAFDYVAKPFDLEHLNKILKWTLKLTP